MRAQGLAKQKKPPWLSTATVLFCRKSMGFVCETWTVLLLEGSGRYICSTGHTELYKKATFIFCPNCRGRVSSWRGSAAQTGRSWGHLSLCSAGDMLELLLLSWAAQQNEAVPKAGTPCSVKFLSASVNTCSSECAPSLLFSSQLLVFDIGNSYVWKRWMLQLHRSYCYHFCLVVFGFLGFFAAGVCQKHVLHLLPGMSSDSDIECDTENEEQEDATSTSEGFNHAFSVQSSSEGRVDSVSPPAPALPHASLSPGDMGCCESTGHWQCCGGIKAQKSSSKIWNSSLGILIKTRSKQERGTLCSLEKSV